MNVQEMMTKVFQLAGEPSDLCPYNTPGDPATFDLTFAVPGSSQLLAWINQALVRIANWKYGDETILRFRHLRKSMFFKHKPEMTGSVVAGAADTVSIAGFAPANAVNQFNGWIIVVTHSVTGVVQKRLVVSTAGVGAVDSVLQVHQDWDSVPDALCTYALYKRFYTFVPAPVAGTVDEYMISGDIVNEIGDVIGVRDLVSNSDLQQAPQGERFTSTQLSLAIPSMFSIDGKKLVFDSAWNQSRSYEILYYAHPILITSVSQAIDIPVPFHEAIVQWAVHSIQMREQDFNGAYATKRDLQELMQTLRNNGEMMLDEEQVGFSVYS